MVADNACLTQESAANLAQAEARQVFPRVDVLDCGITCASRTNLSSRSDATVGCIQKGAEATGLSFAICHDVVLKHNPYAGVYECVKEVRQPVPGLLAVNIHGNTRRWYNGTMAQW